MILACTLRSHTSTSSPAPPLTRYREPDEKHSVLTDAEDPEDSVCRIAPDACDSAMLPPVPQDPMYWSVFGLDHVWVGWSGGGKGEREYLSAPKKKQPKKKASVVGGGEGERTVVVPTDAGGCSVLVGVHFCYGCEGRIQVPHAYCICTRRKSHLLGLEQTKER